MDSSENLQKTLDNLWQGYLESHEADDRQQRIAVYLLYRQLRKMI